MTDNELKRDIKELIYQVPYQTAEKARESLRNKYPGKAYYEHINQAIEQLVRETKSVPELREIIEKAARLGKENDEKWIHLFNDG